MAASKKTARKSPAKKQSHPRRRATDKPATGIGALCEGLILKGKDNAHVLEKVRAAFPDASTTGSTVSWYRSKLKREGKLAT